MRLDLLRSATIVTCLALTVIRATADRSRPPQPTRIVTTSGRFALEITPEAAPGYGSCRAALVENIDGQPRTRWQRFLINNDAPRRVFLAESGDYVVTMDEWYTRGKLPLVLYGRGGELILVHSLESLGITSKTVPNFYRTVEHTISNIWWADDCIAGFDLEEEYFFVRLHWGRLLIVDLRTGKLLEAPTASSSPGHDAERQAEWDRVQARAAARLRTLVIEFMRSPDPLHRRAGAFHAGQMRVCEAIPLLRTLLNDETRGLLVPSTDAGPYPVRQAAWQALQAMGESIVLPAWPRG